jgi:biopolymer transport protein ExbD
MGMSSGGSKGGAVPTINVTPLIDVLLVLLIIFMIITPVKPSKFEAKVPAEPKKQDNLVVEPNPLSLVVTVNPANRTIQLNQQPAGTIEEPAALSDILKAEFSKRERENTRNAITGETEKTLFIKSPTTVKYGDVVKIIDAVKGAGAKPIGLQIDDLSAN